MNTLRTVWTVAACGLAFSFPASVSGDVVIPPGIDTPLVNGSLEAGPSLPPDGLFELTLGSTSLTGWVAGLINGDGFFVGQIAGVSAWPPSDGARSVRLIPNGFLSQSVPTLPGAHYAVLADYAPDPLFAWPPDQGPAYVTPRATAMNVPTFDTFGGGFNDAGWDVTGDPQWFDGWIGSFVAASELTDLRVFPNDGGAVLDRVRLRQLAGPLQASYAPAAASAQCANNLTTPIAFLAGGKPHVAFTVGPEDGGEECDNPTARIVILQLDGLTIVRRIEVPVDAGSTGGFASEIPLGGYSIDGDTEGRIWIITPHIKTGFGSIFDRLDVWRIEPSSTRALLDRSITPPFSLEQPGSGFYPPVALATGPSGTVAFAYGQVQFHAPIGGGEPFAIVQQTPVEFRVGGTWGGALLNGAEAPPQNTVVLDLDTDGSSVFAYRAGQSGVLHQFWTVADFGGPGQIGAMSTVTQSSIGPAQFWSAGFGHVAVHAASNTAWMIGGPELAGSPARQAIRPRRFPADLNEGPRMGYRAETDWVESRETTSSPTMAVAEDEGVWMAWWYTDATNQQTGRQERGLRLYRGKDAGPCCYDNYHRITLSAEELMGAGIYVDQSSPPSLSLVALSQDEALLALVISNTLHLIALHVETFGGNGSPTGDINGDGTVDAIDLSVLLGAWGPCVACPADLDGNGFVAGPDLAILLGNWGAGS